MTDTLLTAAAGAGKTYELVSRALSHSNKCLITTFTKENKNEIEKILFELNQGVIPPHITIQTWFSFLLEHGVKPFQGKLTRKKIKGLFLVNSKSGIKYRNRKGFPVLYPESEVDKHYFNFNYEIYSDKISKFVLKCDELSEGQVFNRLEKIYTEIYIDEVQDLAGHDYRIIKKLLSTSIRITMAGDPRQVTYLTHFPTVEKKYSEGKIEKYLMEKCKKELINYDYSTLIYSRRNCQSICDYANKLFPEFPQVQSCQKEKNKHSGIYLVSKEDVDDYLYSYSPLQLRHNRQVNINQNFEALNFGISKGKTVDRVLIYPTKEIKKWIKNNDYKLKFKSRCQFYVAISRAKFSVGIVWDESKGINNLDFFNTGR